MSNLDQFEYCVHPHQTDINDRITPWYLASYILDAAGLAATKRHFEMRELQKTGHTWIVSRVSIHVDKYPTAYQRFTIETWVAKVNSTSTIRNFRIYDEEKNLIAYASTLWAIINFNTRRLVAINDIVDAQKHLHPELIEALPQPIRIATPDTKSTYTTTSHKVVFSDLDINHHANSMKYLQWGIDTLSLDELKTNYISDYSMNFLNETNFGQELTLNTHHIDNDSTDHYIVNILNNDTVACRVQLKLSSFK